MGGSGADQQCFDIEFFRTYNLDVSVFLMFLEISRHNPGVAITTTSIADCCGDDCGCGDSCCSRNTIFSRSSVRSSRSSSNSSISSSSSSSESLPGR